MWLCTNEKTPNISVNRKSEIRDVAQIWKDRQKSWAKHETNLPLVSIKMSKKYHQQHTIFSPRMISRQISAKKVLSSHSLKSSSRRRLFRYLCRMNPRSRNSSTNSCLPELSSTCWNWSYPTCKILNRQYLLFESSILLSSLQENEMADYWLKTI